MLGLVLHALLVRAYPIFEDLLLKSVNSLTQQDNEIAMEEAALNGTGKQY